MTETENTILKGKIFPPLIRFTLPLMLAVLIQALYGAVDLIVVGKFGSTASVSAVSNGSQIMHTITGVITGMSMGVTVMVGNFVGAKNDRGAADTVGGMVKLFSVVTVLITAVMLVFARQIANIMRVPDQALEGTVVYLRVCSAGTVFIVAFNAISGLFRGAGDSKSPLIFVSIACVVNVVLDLVFVGVFKLDVFGAALATIIAQACSVVFSLRRIKSGKLPFRVTLQNLKSSWKPAKSILRVGLPVAMQELLVSISFLIIMAIINSISLVASASIGIAEKLFLFLAIVPMSFTSSLSAFVAQNVGAKQEQRALRSLGIAILISFSFGIIMSSLTFFAGDILAGIFENDPVVIASTKDYLRGASGEYMIIAIVFCLLGYFNGIGKTSFVMIEGILTSFLARIPLSYYFSRLPDATLFTIGLAVPISAVFSLCISLGYFIFVRRKRLGTGRLQQ